MDMKKLKNILEAVLLAAERSLTVVQLEALFELDEERPSRDEIRQALHEMAEDYKLRGYELKQVASGFRLQVKQEYATWVGRLWEEKPARYTRALLETMALIAYRQPITRGEIEEVRGVSVSTNIIKTLMERDWIKVLGHKDVPGKPTLYGTTKEFLDYFNLQKLDQLPTLAEIQDLDAIHPELELDEDTVADVDTGTSESITNAQTENHIPEESSSETSIAADTTGVTQTLGNNSGSNETALDDKVDVSTEAEPVVLANEVQAELEQAEETTDNKKTNAFGI